MGAGEGRPGSGERARHDLRDAIVVAAVVVVVAVAAAGTGVLRDVDEGVAANGDLALRALVGGLIGAAVGGLVVVAVRRFGAAAAAALGLAGGTAMVLVVVVFSALGATTSVSTVPLHVERSAAEVDESVATTRPESSGDSRRSGAEAPSALPSWVGTVLAIIGLVFVVPLVLGLSRAFRMPRVRLRGGWWRDRSRAELAVDELDVDAAADTFEHSAASIGDGVDPRAAIIAAYARLLDGLSEAGCTRRSYEAPEEHLRRSLVVLGVSADHMEVIVDRFVVARFSTHPLTAADVAAVRAALERAARQLRDHAVAHQAAMAPT